MSHLVLRSLGTFPGSISNIDEGESSCRNNSNHEVISGVVGAPSSVTSIQVAHLLRLFKIPQVSNLYSTYIHSQNLWVIYSFFSGEFLLNQPRAEQQATIRVFLADHSIRPEPSAGHGGDNKETRLEIHFHPLRGVQLRHKGKININHVFLMKALIHSEHVHDDEKKFAETGHNNSDGFLLSRKPWWIHISFRSIRVNAFVGSFFSLHFFSEKNLLFYSLAIT